MAEADARYARVLTEAGESANEAAPSLTGRHLEDAMKIVTDANYCIKCHIVGDFDPVSSDRAKAPDLSGVYNRLRSEHLRRWLARPASVLPYTSMPVNIPYSPDEELLGTTVPQELYRGNSLEQLEALVDLLMNFDRYTGWRSPISPLVRESNLEQSASDQPASDGDP